MSCLQNFYNSDQALFFQLSSRLFKPSTLWHRILTLNWAKVEIPHSKMHFLGMFLFRKKLEIKGPRRDSVCNFVFEMYQEICLLIMDPKLGVFKQKVFVHLCNHIKTCIILSFSHKYHFHKSIDWCLLIWKKLGEVYTNTV